MVYENKTGYIDSLGLIPKEGSAFLQGILRIAVGWVFLWAFLDKLLGLGFATAPENAWINGGSPITGFLMFGTNPESPLASFFAETLVGFGDIMNYVLMGMFLFVGIALVLGIFVRFASLAGITFMLSVWLSQIPLANNPIVDDHIIYAIILVFFIFSNSGSYLGLGQKWNSLRIVERYPVLK